MGAREEIVSALSAPAIDGVEWEPLDADEGRRAWVHWVGSTDWCVVYVTQYVPDLECECRKLDYLLEGSFDVSIEPLEADEVVGAEEGGAGRGPRSKSAQESFDGAVRSFQAYCRMYINIGARAGLFALTGNGPEEGE
jgi:hypothetical protein